MKIVKKYLLFSVILFFYLMALSLVLQQFSFYQRAYYSLSILISNPSISVVRETVQMEEENVIEEKKE